MKDLFSTRTISALATHSTLQSTRTIALCRRAVAELVEFVRQFMAQGVDMQLDD